MIRDVAINQTVVERDTAKRCVKGRLHLVQCQICGFVYNCQYDDKLYWDNCQIINVSISSHKFDNYLQMIAVTLKDFFKDKKLVCLEIGCGNGEFLKRLYKETNWKMIGYDPFCKPQKVKNFVLYNTKFNAGKLEETPSLIICRHIIEHIDDLDQFLDSIRRVISKNGFLYFETPDLEWSINNIGILDFFYEHCNYFTLTTLKLLLYKSGFRVLCVKRLFGLQHLGIIAQICSQTVFSGNISKTMEIDKQIAFMNNYYKREQFDIRNWKMGVQILRKNGAIGILGASSKGCNFLNIIDPEKELIEFAIEYNIKKVGNYIANTGHPIIHISDKIVKKIKYIIVINEAYYEECLEWSENVENVYTLKMLEKIGKSRLSNNESLND